MHLTHIEVFFKLKITNLKFLFKKKIKTGRHLGFKVGRHVPAPGFQPINHNCIGLFIP